MIGFQYWIKSFKVLKKSNKFKQPFNKNAGLSIVLKVVKGTYHEYISELIN